jgi:hypothetical protein
MTDPVIAKIQEIQALHKRILKAKDAGLDPDPADLEAAKRINEDPRYSTFDRVWAPDER